MIKRGRGSPRKAVATPKELPVIGVFKETYKDQNIILEFSERFHKWKVAVNKLSLGSKFNAKAQARSVAMKYIDETFSEQTAKPKRGRPKKV